jgi:CRISPR/Cas system-associated endonuclease Cas1
MLSLGYAVLFGACAVTVTGAHLDPDLGALHEGPAGLVHDIAESFKPGMVDTVVFPMVQRGLDPSLYECTEKRCHLDNELTGALIEALHQSIQQDKIDRYVCSYTDSLLKNSPFQVMY